MGDGCEVVVEMRSCDASVGTVAAVPWIPCDSTPCAPSPSFDGDGVACTLAPVAGVVEDGALSGGLAAAGVGVGVAMGAVVMGVVVNDVRLDRGGGADVISESASGRE